MDKNSQFTSIELILGGARSGKSRYAEQQAQAFDARPASVEGATITYIATAQAYDEEMVQRIKRHQSDRPDHWRTVEAPLKLSDAIQQSQSNVQCAGILVDCLTLWLSNWLMQEDDVAFQSERSDLIDCITTIQSEGQIHIWLDSNEVGQGIVPMGELSRRFVDEAGWLHQDIAAVADKVTWVAAGLPVALKHNGQLQLGS